MQPFRGGASKNKQKPTAVNIHATETEHPATYDDFKIIGRDRSRNNFHLKVKESLMIKKLAPELNGAESSIPLMLF